MRAVLLGLCWFAAYFIGIGALHLFGRYRIFAYVLLATALIIAQWVGRAESDGWWAEHFLDGRGRGR